MIECCEYSFKNARIIVGCKPHLKEKKTQFENPLTVTVSCVSFFHAGYAM